jgi:hypothetical protein
MQRLAASGAVSTSCPQTLIFPEVGARKPVINFMVVDLPAPFGPRNPSTSPGLTANEMSSTASKSPYRFVRLLISII